MFDDIFDFNNDGELDFLERAAQFDCIMHSMNSMDNGQGELLDAGIDPEELEFMSGPERREILEDAGLDPDEYDF